MKKADNNVYLIYCCLVQISNYNFQKCDADVDEGELKMYL